jgi:16S rRNA (adenine1518-N6/adenine1519-N6)-dimethyltransferase
MNLLEKTKQLCAENNIRPARSKGQNFLIDENVYDKIIEAADLKKTDTVLEVGPGLGFLTAKLVEKAGRVIAVELDDKLSAYLKENLKKENVEIINENILDFDLNRTTPSPFPRAYSGQALAKEGGFKVVANLPYNITSVFIRKMLTSENKPTEMILMLQKEVAERICAKPGDMSLLALSVQFFSEPKILFQVPATAFYPAPEVDSALIKVRITNYEVRSELEKKFFRLAKISFSAKRKMLKNNLANGLHISNKEAEEILAKAGLDLKIRAEDLAIEDWVKLVEII